MSMGRFGGHSLLLIWPKGNHRCLGRHSSVLDCAEHVADPWFGSNKFQAHPSRGMEDSCNCTEWGARLLNLSQRLKWTIAAGHPSVTFQWMPTWKHTNAVHDVTSFLTWNHWRYMWRGRPTFRRSRMMSTFSILLNLPIDGWFNGMKS